VSVWIAERSIQGAQNYGPEIISAIERCKVLVLLCSGASLHSGHVAVEVQLAFEAGLPRLPLRLDDTPFPDQIRYWLTGVNWIDIRGPADQWLPRVLQALEQLGVSAPRPPMTTPAVARPGGGAANTSRQAVTRFASGGDVHLAYQVVGEGPMDLVFVSDWFSHLEAEWDDPLSERFLRRLASFSRLVLFDKRGTGLSDPVALDHLPTAEEWMEDLRIVLDAIGSRSTALVCSGAGAILGTLFAATYPERTAALVIVDGWVTLTKREDYPHGVAEYLRGPARQWALETWGTGGSVEVQAPSLARDASFREWRGRYERLAASPGTVAKMFDFLQDIDTRRALSTVTAPTLVMHSVGDQFVWPSHGHYIAEHISGARFVELPGADHLCVGQDSERILEEIEEFLTGSRTSADPDRVLTTLLFTDIVDSTDLAASMGSERWRQLLDRHDAVVRHQLRRARGREIKAMGDGFLATFDGPARAVRCTLAIVEELRPLGLTIRAGLHTGECEVRGDDLGGLAVHIAARVSASAGAGEVVVSSTVKDLVAGSGIGFADRGEHELKGVPDRWRLFLVTNG
jgi:class 3 adenylate cyclase